MLGGDALAQNMLKEWDKARLLVNRDWAAIVHCARVLKQRMTMTDAEFATAFAEGRAKYAVWLSGDVPMLADAD
jgi:hypothetical protein